MSKPFSKRKGRDKLLQDILQYAQKIPDARVRDIVRGVHQFMVLSDHAGICARIHDPGQGMKRDRAGDDLYKFRGSALELAMRFLRPSYESRDAISCAMAAINSILPVPEDALPLKAQQLIERYGKGKNIVIIGHFPFVERTGAEFRNMWVLERYPRPGDLSVEVAEDVLPQADVVALTATTLLNGTCAGLLRLIPGDAFTIMLGPSTPFAPCLFDWGIDALAGISVSDEAQLKTSVQVGGRYREIKGTEPFTWLSDDGSQKSEVRSQKSEVRATEPQSHRATELQSFRRQTTDDRRRINNQ